MAEIREIGTVRSRFTEPADPFRMRKEISTIEVLPEFEEGLFDIESNSHLQIIFHFHKSDSYRLKGAWYFGDQKGVFACRSPKRPGAVGLTTVELLERSGRILTVRGLDALDGTPVLDIKPLSAGADLPSAGQLEEEFEIAHPRAEITRMIKTRDTRGLLRRSGVLHGHFCPALAAGVLASVEGLHRLAETAGKNLAEMLAADGMEELLAVCEINSCLVDGIQLVSGCTFGNNSLIYRDLGKSAVTFALRSGGGVRISLRSGFRELLDELDPDFRKLFDQVVAEHDRDPQTMRAFKAASRRASFALLEVPAERFLDLQETAVDLPRYAPIRESVICSSCGESIMGGKEASGGQQLCRSCAPEPYAWVDGRGIHEKERI